MSTCTCMSAKCQFTTLDDHTLYVPGFANTRILRQNCSDDSTEVTEGVTLSPEIFSNKHDFVLTFFTTNTIDVNCERCKP